MMRFMNFFREGYGMLAVAAIFLAVFGIVATSQSADRFLVRPADPGTGQSEANVSLKPYEIRRGQVVLESDILPQPPNGDSETKIAASTRGTETINMSFFDDVKYEVRVDSVVCYPDGTKIINGSIIDHKIGTVVLTIGSDGFLITLQDMNQALLFRVAGDSQSSAGTVTEIDMTKIPSVIR